jgi:hypothetical protein
MLNGDTLLDAIVAKYRDIPELVAALDGDPERIFAYKDDFPGAASVSDVLWTLANKQVMVVYQGFSYVRWGSGMAQEHRFSIYARIASIYWYLFQDGVPAHGSGLPIQYEEIVFGCDPMGRGSGPRGERKTLPVSQTSAIDYLQFDFSLIEK